MSIQGSALSQTLKVIRNYYQPRYTKIKLFVCQWERHCIEKALHEFSSLTHTTDFSIYLPITKNFVSLFIRS